MNTPLINKTNQEVSSSGSGIEFTVPQNNQSKLFEQEIHYARNQSFSIQAAKKFKDYQDQNITDQMVNIARLQIFDVSYDYDPLFLSGRVPKQLYPKQIQSFKTQNYRKTVIETFLSAIPIIPPFNTLFMLWQFFQTIIILFMFFYIPLEIFFTDVIRGETPSSFLVIKIFIVISIFGLFLDMLIMFNVSYLQFGQLEQDREKIALKYIKWDFIVDLNCFICLVISFETTYTLFRYVFFAKFYYLVKFDGKMKQILQLRSTFRALYQLIKIFLVLFFVSHLSACFFYGVAVQQVDVYDNPNSWLIESGYLTQYEAPSIQDFSLWYKYEISLYWSLTTVVTVGYGDITPKNQYETGIAMLTMLFSGMIFAFNVSTIRETIQELNRNNQMFDEYMIVINRYMNLKQISQTTQNKIQEYLEYYYQEEKNRQPSTEAKLIALLPPELKEQLYAEAARSFLNSSAFCHQEYSIEFLKRISCVIEEVHYGTGELVYQENHHEEDPCLYYIIQGCVLLFHEVQDRKFDNEIKIGLCRNYEVFNEYSFYTGFVPKTSAKCILYTSLYKIRRSIFIQNLKESQEDFEKFHLLLTKFPGKQFYKNLGMSCFTCKSDNHTSDECDVTHYLPDRLQILKQYWFTRPMGQTREKHQRKKYKTHEHAWKMILDYENVAYDIIMDRQGLHKTRLSQINDYNTQMDESNYRMSQDIHRDFVIYDQQEEQPTPESPRYNQLKSELRELKQLISLMADKLGVQAPQKKQQKVQEEIILQEQKFIPAKPNFLPPEVTFEIDEIKNYEIFQPNYNFAIIVKDIENPIRFRSLSRLVRRTTRK